jgi:pimeloyl-ACP methyl ester carboxylesterase
MLRRPPPRLAIARYLTGPQHVERLARPLTEALARVRPDVLATRVRQVLTVDVRRELAEAGRPILYLQGADDRAVPPRAARQILDVNPAVKLVQIAGPHLLLQAERERCREAIARFIEGGPASGGSLPTLAGIAVPRARWGGCCGRRRLGRDRGARPTYEPYLRSR